MISSVGTENSVPEFAIKMLADAKTKLENAKTKVETTVLKRDKFEKRTEEEWLNAFKGVR